MALSLPIDINIPGKHKFLQNIRVTRDGVLQSRPRLESLYVLTASTDLVHSIRKLVDKASNNFNYITGAGTKIFTGNTTPLAQKDTGYSGKPLSIVNFRPEESIETYAYIADSLKMCKISASNVLSDIGLTPPNAPINWKLAEPAKKVLDNLTAGTLADWTITNGIKSIQSRVNTTITAYLADGTLPEFVSIIPAAFSAEIQEGAILTINGDDRIVEKVTPSGLASGVATIAAISYDSGSTGLCYITLSIPVTEIYRDSILYLNASEYVRIIDVIRGSNDISVLRTKTVGTFAVGNSVQGFASFRIYTSAAYAAGQTVVADGLRDAITGAGISDLIKVANYDLSNANNLPLSDDALFHISIKVDDPTKINEVQIKIAFDTTFTDYIFHVVNPNFLTPSAQQTAASILAQQQALQRREIINSLANPHQLTLEETTNIEALGGRVFPESVYFPLELPITGINETALGQNAWTELLIPFSSFEKVGVDVSKTRKDVKAIKVSIDAKSATNVYIDSIWIGGASGTDSAGIFGESLQDYNYIFRYRDPSTRTISNWSPPLRQGIRSKKDRIIISIPANSNPATYKVDIARIGGTQNDFKILSSILNDGSTFVDDVSDYLIADNDKAGRNTSDFSKIGDFDYFKPFAVLDTPKSGTCNVVGTELTVTSTANLKTSYPRGTYILVNGKLTKFYSNPTSTSKVSLEDNLGTLSGVKYEIAEPLITGQPLAIMAGPFGEGFEGLVIFGAGDINSPGTVYWLDSNSPDTQSDLNKREITSPTEPIMAIVIYDSFAFVYTTQRSFTLSPDLSGGYLDFVARENANSKGLFARKGICVARTFIYQLVDDGIYRSEGVGNPQSITDEDLHNLFPHNGIVPTSQTLFGQVIYPPDFTKPDEIWLFSTEDHVFWRFVDTNNNQVCLVYDTRTEGWISYDTFLDAKIGAIYKEEDESDIDIVVGQIGIINKFTSTATNEYVIESKVIPFAEDLGDFRIEKDFREIVIDCIPGTGNGLDIITATNNLTTLQTQVDVANNTNRDLVIVNLNSGIGIRGRNITNLFKWPLNSGTEILKQSISYLPLGEVITDRYSDYELDENLAPKYWRGVIIDADTFGLNKTLYYHGDEAGVVFSLVINHNGRTTKLYTFNQVNVTNIPFLSHKIRRGSNDGIKWIPYNEQYIFEKELDDTEKYIQSVILDADTSGLDKVLKFYDGNNILTNTIIINHNGRITKKYTFDKPIRTRKMWRGQADLTNVIWKLYDEEYSYYETIDNIKDDSAKYWQGILIDADTYGQTKTLKYYDETGFLHDIIDINHNGRQSKPYAFAKPFVSNKIIRQSDDGIPWVLESEEYKYDKEPELAKFWQSQLTSHGIDGFKQIKRLRIPIASTSIVIFTLNIDGEEITRKLPSTNGGKESIDFYIPAKRWSLISYRLAIDLVNDANGPGFRLYKRDLEVWIRKWNGEGDFQVVKPLGEDDNVTETRI